MREILFRGKRLDNGEWVYGDLIHTLGGHPLICIKHVFGAPAEVVEVDYATLGQYTGLTDKNGTRIFEGDIIKTAFSKSIVKYGEYKHIHAQVGYRNGDVGFYVCHIDEIQRNFIRNDLLYFNEQCEVVGNVHDNFDMLEGGEK